MKSERKSLIGWMSVKIGKKTFRKKKENTLEDLMKKNLKG